MDDIVSLLLLFVFVILPIIQQVLGKRSPPEEVPGEIPEDEPAEWKEVPIARETLPPRAPPRPGADPAGGWSSGWGKWPSEASAEEAATLEEAPVERRIERPAMHRPLETAIRTDLPERTEVEEAAVASERVLVTLRERLAGARVTEAPAPARDLPGHPPILQVRGQSSRAARLPLHNPAELRRAYVMSEVLGPPVSMRGEGNREQGTGNSRQLTVNS